MRARVLPPSCPFCASSPRRRRRCLAPRARAATSAHAARARRCPAGPAGRAPAVTVPLSCTPRLRRRRRRCRRVAPLHIRRPPLCRRAAPPPAARAGKDKEHPKEKKARKQLNREAHGAAKYVWAGFAGLLAAILIMVYLIASRPRAKLDPLLA